MKKLFAIMFLILAFLIAPVASFAVGPTEQVITYPYSADPCQNNNITKSSAAISTLTTTNSIVPANSAKTYTYVCMVKGSIVGTTPGMYLVTGTTVTTACDTGPISALTGTIAPTSGTIIALDYGGTIIRVSAAKTICSIMTGTTPTFNGLVTYIQQ